MNRDDLSAIEREVAAAPRYWRELVLTLTRALREAWAALGRQG